MERLYIERYLNSKWFGRFRNLSFAETVFELGEGIRMSPSQAHRHRPCHPDRHVELNV